MKRSRRFSACAAAVMLAGTATTGAALAGPSPAAAATRPAAKPRPTRTVTLVTGDRVTVSGDGSQVSAQAGPGRAGTMFTITTVRGHVQVVPADAAPLLAVGRLDARLFDVTGLLAGGYDKKDQLPLIVTGVGGAAASAAVRGVAGVDGLTRPRDLPAIKGVALGESRTKAADSWRALTGGGPAPRTLRSDVGKVWLDAMLTPALDVSVPHIGAPTAWAAGYTGAGSTVAVLDTGIDDTHPDLAGQVVARQNFTDGAEPDNDRSGHGTHVASTIAGTGAASGGKYTGVAPGAKLLDGKVCIIEGCAESWILAGMTWAVVDQHAKVVNLSLGSQDDPTVVDPVEQAIQTLSDQYGTLFVVAAGNSDGSVVEGGVQSPGTADAALTVGAMDDTDAVADFSERGPTGDGRLKPDIAAPGVNITAARGKDATAVPGDPGDLYTTLSGTSMATPHVAGAAAILAQEHPDWSGAQLKAALMASATPNPAYGVYAQGAGRVDVAHAITQTVAAVTPRVSFGKQVWPHADDAVLHHDVTYHNYGSADLTMNPTMNTLNPDGTPTPTGLFTVSPASVRVPAGGDATVTATVDTRVAGPDGYLGGWLTASAGNLTVRTPVAVDKEVESYDVTLTHLDRNGAAPLAASTILSEQDSRSVQFDWSDSGSDNAVTIRVPRGRYTLVSSIVTGYGQSIGGSGKPTAYDGTLLSQPDLEVDRPLSVDLDARLGQPISVTVPRSSAQQVFAEVAAYTRRPQGTAGIAVAATSFADLYSAQVGPAQTDANFLSIVAGQWAQTDAIGGTDDSPYFYSLLFPNNGRMVTGYQRTVADGDLAQVHADFALAQPGTLGGKVVYTGLADPGVGMGGPTLGFHLPFRRTEYYNIAPGVESAGQFLESTADGTPLGNSESTGYTEYGAGHNYREQWNQGVFAPSLPNPSTSLNGWQGVTRSGNSLGVDVPLYGDGSGHAGADVSTDAHATLFRDGVKIADLAATRFANVTVAPGDAGYRLELHAQRGAPFALSTKTDIAWTFRSASTATETPVALPLWTIRFSPRLDQTNTSAAGRVQAVPVSITAQPGSNAGTLVSRSVEASFDDGATWRPVQMRDGAALVVQPGGSGLVSLRVRAADSRGNTVTQTIIRAYRYGPVQ